MCREAVGSADVGIRVVRISRGKYRERDSESSKLKVETKQSENLEKVHSFSRSVAILEPSIFVISLTSFKS